MCHCVVLDVVVVVCPPQGYRRFICLTNVAVTVTFGPTRQGASQDTIHPVEEVTTVQEYKYINIDIKYTQNKQKQTGNEKRKSHKHKTT